MDSANRNELSLPSKMPSSAKEVLRLWIDDEKNWFILNIDKFPDAAMWGLVMADLARHAARAHSQSSGQEYKNILHKIKQGFDAEWDNPTDEPVGEFEN